MNTPGYLTRGYPHSGYPRGYGTDTGIIFIKRGRDVYHTIRTHWCPLTSLSPVCFSSVSCNVESIPLNVLSLLVLNFQHLYF